MFCQERANGYRLLHIIKENLEISSDIEKMMYIQNKKEAVNATERVEINSEDRLITPLQSQECLELLVKKINYNKNLY